jgi:tetratricopeptide (TPR) repeat protein
MTFRKKIALLLAAAILCSSPVMLVSCGGTEESEKAEESDTESKVKYSQAKALMSDGKYEEAISAFEELDGYKDSKDKIAECRDAIKDRDYEEASELMKDGKYEEAITAFEALDGHKDSKSKIVECEEAIKEKEQQEKIKQEKEKEEKVQSYLDTTVNFAAAVLNDAVLLETIGNELQTEWAAFIWDSKYSSIDDTMAAVAESQKDNIETVTANKPNIDSMWASLMTVPEDCELESIKSSVDELYDAYVDMYNCVMYGGLNYEQFTEKFSDSDNNAAKAITKLANLVDTYKTNHPYKYIGDDIAV